MGLAASQARLLTITTRKSDCEFQSMRYSHQKIALSRDLTDISNEYQNSLNATKLVYDFYGTGDETTPVSYSLLMTPSELNSYIPILTTDSAGRVVLDNKYAAAAKAAGIPNEGLACQPSQTVRNKFLEELKNQGIITSTQYETYSVINYNQDYGAGSNDYLISTKTQDLTLAQMVETYLDSSEALYINLDTESIAQLLNGYTNDGNNDVEIRNVASGTHNTCNDEQVSIKDILNGDYRILAQVDAEKTAETNGALSQVVNIGVIQAILTEIEKIFGTSSEMASIIAQAQANIAQWLDGSTQVVNKDGFTKEHGSNGYDGVINCMDNDSYDNDFSWWNVGKFRWGGEGQDAYDKTSDLKGILYYNVHNNRWGQGDRAGEDFSDGIAINISNIAKMYLTYIVMGLEEAEGNASSYNVDSGTKTKDSTNDKWVDLNNDDDSNKVFTLTTQEAVNANQTLMAAAYDAILTQICLRGWVENDNVTDKDYLQSMYKNGQLFLCKCSDDGYYSAETYSTETRIKEVTDDDAIARAEAKYNTEKQKINHKEEVLDLKMKNLDSEISSLTTEYDSVKNLISKNAERSFKRYEA